jgi:hydroxypyruvate isomerase
MTASSEAQESPGRVCARDAPQTARPAAKASLKSGFAGVEFLFPYEYSPEEIGDLPMEWGTQIVLFNMPSRKLGRRRRGSAGLPGREQDFREGLEKTLVYAERLRVPDATRRADLAACSAILIANLKHAAEKLTKPACFLQSTLVTYLA